MFNVVVYAIPVFSVLVLVELAYGIATHRNNYRLNDALASFSQGLLSQVVAVCTPLAQLGFYVLVYRRAALLHAEAFWNGAAGLVLATVMFDFCDYWLHRTSHRTALFWAAHVVHHQSQEFNFSTALRQESTYVLLGWPFYLPMALLGVTPEAFVVAGTVVLFYQFWIHTEHVGRLGWLDRVFSTPSNHRVHHAVNDGYVDRNYGAMLIVWDRIFRTFAQEREPCVYGTRAPLESWDPLWAVFVGYWTVACDAWRTASWRDKLRIWFMPPGWRPADLALRDPLPAFDIRAVRRYDPPAGRVQGIVAALQFGVVALATCAYLWQSDDWSTAHAAVLAVPIAAALWGVGALLQRRIGIAGALYVDAAALAFAWAALR